MDRESAGCVYVTVYLKCESKLCFSFVECIRWMLKAEIQQEKSFQKKKQSGERNARGGFLGSPLAE